jgi:hypothetical protein
VGSLPALTGNLENAFNFDDVPNGSLDGKIALVTGANIGLGYWTGKKADPILPRS